MGWLRRVTCPRMMPDSSRRFTRREQGVGERPTDSASSRLLMRALPCMACKTLRSVRSSFMWAPSAIVTVAIVKIENITNKNGITRE